MHFTNGRKNIIHKSTSVFGLVDARLRLEHYAMKAYWRV
jgi:hypothetical protein